MSLGHGASIVRNGLVFYYDMENTGKSWKGKPTTNYAYENGYTSNGSLTTDNIPNYKQLKNLAGDVKDVRYINNNTTNWLDLYSVNNISLAAGEAITISCWIYTDKPANSFNSNGNFGATLGTNASLGGETNIPTGQWFFFSKTKTNTTASTITVNTLRIETRQYTVWTDSEIDVYAANPQWEIGSFATPFVEGTRSNTEAIVDLTGNSTIAAQSLTYNSDNTFEFDGTTSTLNLGYVPEMVGANITQEAWVRAYSFTNWHGIISNMSSWGTGFSLQIGTEQNIAAMVSGSYLKTSWVPSTNTWYHICATHRSSDNLNVLYVNGIQENSTTRAVSYETNAETKIGCFYTSPSLLLNGEIASIKTYNKALTATEVKQNFEATRGRYGI